MAARGLGLAPAVSARSRSTVVVCSPFVPRTVKVIIGGPCSRLRSANSVPVIASSARIASDEPQVEPLGLLRNGDTRTVGRSADRRLLKVRPSRYNCAGQQRDYEWI